MLTAAVLLGGCAADTRDGMRLESRTPPAGASTAPPAERSGSAAAPDRERRLGRTQPSGLPALARLTIPALDVAGLRVVPYRGRTDDAPGTRIQNRGLAASPHGPRGGVGPGGIGNYQVTAHRLSSTRAFEFLPSLRVGQRVQVRTARWVLTYEIRDTRRTSFRSPASLARQRAAVPGHPGREPTRAMITLSTCATVEDHAAGNFWADRFDNPEHRIDKIGVLVRSLPVRG